jgi:phosphate transport system substrate-binding protein
MALVACWLGLGLGTLCAANASEVRIGGTGSALSGIRLVADAYRQQHPDTLFTIVSGLGSSGAISALASEKVDLAFAARPPTPDEQSEGLSAAAFARTPLVIATGPDRPLDDLSYAQLAAIYQGTMSTWPDSRTLRLILRPRSDSDNIVLRSMSPGMASAVDTALARKGMTVAATDQENADLLEKTPGAIGTTTLALVLAERRRLKVLSLDGVSPSIQALSQGRYPHSKTFYLITGANPSPEARRFVAFLRSSAAQAILAQHGHLVLDGAPN